MRKLLLHNMLFCLISRIRSALFILLPVVILPVQAVAGSPLITWQQPDSARAAHDPVVDSRGPAMNGPATDPADYKLLGEIIVKPTNKWVRNKDTLNYSTTAFRPASEEVLEDLLKKIPGIEINKNGTILIQGKSIAALLIEGDDLFSENYWLAGKNLPADRIEKIQVIEGYYPDSLLNGLLSGDKKALNIILKKDHRKYLTGQIASGITQQGRYQHRLTLSSFSGRIKVLGFQRLSNTGDEDPIPDIRNERSYENIQSTPLFTGLAGNGQPAGPLEKGALANKISFHSWSFSAKLPAGITLKNTGWLSGQRNETYREISSYLPALDTAVSREESRFYQRITPWGHMDVKIAFPIGKTSRLEYSGRSEGSKSYSNAWPNSSDGLTGRDITQRHALDLTWRIRKHAALLAGAAYMKEQVFRQLDLRCGDLRCAASQGDGLRCGYLRCAASQGDGLRCGYLQREDPQRGDPKQEVLQQEESGSSYRAADLPELYLAGLPRIGLPGGRLMQAIWYDVMQINAWLYYTCSYRNWLFRINLDHIASLKQLRTALRNKKYRDENGHWYEKDYWYGKKDHWNEEGHLLLPGSFKNNERRLEERQTARFSVTRTISRRGRVLATLLLTRYGSDLKSVSLAPLLHFQWRKGRHVVDAEYRYERQQTGLPELHPDYIFRDQYTLEKADMPPYRYPMVTGVLGYAYSSLPHKLMGYLRLELINKENSPGYDVQVLKVAGNAPGLLYQLLYQDLLLLHKRPGVESNSLMFSGGVDKYIGWLCGGVKLKAGTTLNRQRASPYHLSSGGIHTRYTESYYRLSFRSALKGRLNYNAGTEISYLLLTDRNGSAVSRSPPLCRQKLMNFLDIDLDISERIKMRTSLERYSFRFRNTTGVLQANTACYFADLFISYAFPGNRWIVSLSGKNITNTRSFSQTVYNGYQVSLQQYRLPAVYAIIKAHFRF